MMPGSSSIFEFGAIEQRDNEIMFSVANNKNLKAIGKNYTWLKKEVNKFNINPEDALVVTMDGKGQIFCQEKNKGKK